MRSILNDEQVGGGGSFQSDTIEGVISNLDHVNGELSIHSPLPLMPF